VITGGSAVVTEDSVGFGHNVVSDTEAPSL
jgi:hypothetical protein